METADAEVKLSSSPPPLDNEHPPPMEVNNEESSFPDDEVSKTPPSTDLMTSDEMTSFGDPLNNSPGSDEVKDNDSLKDELKEDFNSQFDDLEISAPKGGDDSLEDECEDTVMDNVSLGEVKDSFEQGFMDEVNLDDDQPSGQFEQVALKLEEDKKEDIEEFQPTSASVEVKQEVEVKPLLAVSSSATTSAPAATMGITTISENSDQYLNISVTSPHKVGDGISSYMAYKIKTNTNMPSFKKKELSVTRRFSDFLGLRDKLNDKYTHLGRIVPLTPDKSVVGMTKVKMSKEEDKTDQSEFIERRRAALERFLNRTAEHPTLLGDPDFREFLELNAELPKANQTSTLSGKSVMKMFSRMGDKVASYATKMEESDQWFEEKTVMVENLESQLRKLHLATEAMVEFRRALAGHTYSVAKSFSALGLTEENTKLSAALDQLGDVFMNNQKVYDQQWKDDLFLLSEMVYDYLGLVTAIKDVLNERVKCWQHCQAVQKDLNKKREYKVKLDVSGKVDKLNDLKAQITETERQLQSAQDNFDKISATFKTEFEVFESKKSAEFKAHFVDYLEKMLQGEESIASQWERYLPEIKQCGA